MDSCSIPCRNVDAGSLIIYRMQTYHIVLPFALEAAMIMMPSPGTGGRKISFEQKDPIRSCGPVIFPESEVWMFSDVL